MSTALLWLAVAFHLGAVGVYGKIILTSGRIPLSTGTAALALPILSILTILLAGIVEH